MTAAIEYLIKHKNDGLITTEEIPYMYMIEYCMPYLGKFVCKRL